MPRWTTRDDVRSAVQSECIYRRDQRLRNCNRPMVPSWCLSNAVDAGLVTGLFPPQARNWSLPAEVPLTPRGARRVVREAVTQSFDKAALALNEDWSTTLDGKQ